MVTLTLLLPKPLGEQPRLKVPFMTDTVAKPVMPVIVTVLDAMSVPGATPSGSATRVVTVTAWSAAGTIGQWVVAVIAGAALATRRLLAAPGVPKSVGRISRSVASR